jgi:hypothetical protein
MSSGTRYYAAMLAGSLVAFSSTSATAQQVTPGIKACYIQWVGHASQWAPANPNWKVIACAGIRTYGWPGVSANEIVGRAACLYDDGTIVAALNEGDIPAPNCGW